MLLSRERIVTYKRDHFQLRGIGIDIGAENFVTISDGKNYVNICKSMDYRVIEKRINSLLNDIEKNKFKIEKLEKIRFRIVNNHISSILNYISTLKINYITIESFTACSIDGHDKGNKLLVDAKPFLFIERLTKLCQKKNIELRKVSESFPSSKKCSVCGNTKENTFKNRVFHCVKCGKELDRDMNSSINLEKAKLFTIIDTSI